MERVFNNLLRVKAYGDDTGWKVANVSMSPPFWNSGQGCLFLPDAVNEFLDKQANQHLSAKLLFVRRALLYQAMLESSSEIESLKEQGLRIESRDLVHTSYFEYSEVLRFIYAHIGSSSRIQPDHLDNEAMEWIESFKSEGN